MSPISSRNNVPPLARSKTPARASTPVATPRSIPKSSDSKSSAGSAAQLMATKGPPTPATTIVQRPRHQLLPGPTCTEHEDRDVDVRQPIDDGRHVAEHGTHPHQRRTTVAIAELGAQGPVLRRDAFVECGVLERHRDRGRDQPEQPLVRVSQHVRVRTPDADHGEVSPARRHRVQQRRAHPVQARRQRLRPRAYRHRRTDRHLPEDAGRGEGREGLVRSVPCSDRGARHEAQPPGPLVDGPERGNVHPELVPEQRDDRRTDGSRHDLARECVTEEPHERQLLDPLQQARRSPLEAPAGAARRFPRVASHHGSRL